MTFHLIDQLFGAALEVFGIVIIVAWTYAIISGFYLMAKIELQKWGFIK